MLGATSAADMHSMPNNALAPSVNFNIGLFKNASFMLLHNIGIFACSTDAIPFAPVINKVAGGRVLPVCSCSMLETAATQCSCTMQTLTLAMRSLSTAINDLSCAWGPPGVCMINVRVTMLRGPALLRNDPHGAHAVHYSAPCPTS